MCPTCRGDGIRPLDPPLEGIAGGWCLGPYAGPLGAAVRRAKFGPDRSAARTLGRLLAGSLDPLPPVRAVVPAPSARATRVRRGFAMAALLAIPVARRLHLPVVHALHVRDGPRQAASTRRGRLANLVGRVTATRDMDGEILLVDDVVTTGSTARTCARELLGAGARCVWLLTICQTGVQVS